MKELDELHKEAWKRCWELIPEATLNCPHAQHRHDPKCYWKSEALSYWIGRADALRDLRWKIEPVTP